MGEDRRRLPISTRHQLLQHRSVLPSPHDSGCPIMSSLPPRQPEVSALVWIGRTVLTIALDSILPLSFLSHIPHPALLISLLRPSSPYTRLYIALLTPVISPCNHTCLCPLHDLTLPIHHSPPWSFSTPFSPSHSLLSLAPTGQPPHPLFRRAHPASHPKG